MKHAHPQQINHIRRPISTKSIATLALGIAITAATQASAGLTFTSLERSVSAGGNSISSSDLASPFVASRSFTEDTGGMFNPATASAQQNSWLDMSTDTLTFAGSASATGGSISDAGASSVLLLNFLVAPDASIEMIFDGLIRGFTGSGIDPGSTGGSGSALIRLSRNGAIVYNNSSGGSGAFIPVDGLLALDAGSYELRISVRASGPPQVDGGSGSADLTFTFVPTPSTMTIALAGGLFAARRRRS